MVVRIPATMNMIVPLILQRGEDVAGVVYRAVSYKTGKGLEL
jgi:hypothetical protein